MAKRILDIESFRAGTYDMGGKPTTVTVSDMREMADDYNANLKRHIAPFTRGHKPAPGELALGMVKELYVKGDSLRAKVEVFDDSFDPTQAPKVSASFFLPGNPSNPRINKLGYRHLASLSAETPRLPNLECVSFSDDDGGTATFTTDVPAFEAGLLQRIYADLGRFLGFGSDAVAGTTDNAEDTDKVALEAAQAMPEAAVAEQSTAVAAGPTESVADASEASATEADTQTAGSDFAERETALSAQQAALEAQAAKLAEREAALQDAECVNFCEGLVASGQLRPCDKGNAKNILSSLYQVQGSVDFSEASLPMADAFKQFLKGLPKVVEFGEFAPEETEPHNPAASFVAAPGYEVDAGQLGEYSRLVRVAQERGISLAEAVAQKL